MEIQDFFQPLDINKLPPESYFEEGSWYHSIEMYKGALPKIAGKKIALIGIETPDDKIFASYEVRKYLYSLKKHENAAAVVDIGNYRFDYSTKAYQSLGYVLSELMTKDITPVILNGMQDITFAQYLAFVYLKRYVNLVTFDARLNFHLRESEKMNDGNYLQKILTEEPNYLFSYSDIGYQGHFADTAILNFLENLFFDMHRLSDIRSNIIDIEPVLRTAHFVSWDLCAVRQSEAPGAINPSPNGFFGEEACLLSRYAGLGSNLKTIGFYQYDLSKDRDGQTAHLVAQMIWYFIDGFLNRYLEHPNESKDDFLKYTASIQNNAYNIVFYKSKRTDRWWMEVPVNEKDFAATNYIMPCSYNDYLAAAREELPDRWWRAMKKLA